MIISKRTVSSAVVISIATLVLAGCSSTPQEQPQVLESPSSELILTEEQALALAEKTYAEYLAISDQIARDGGEGVERLNSSVSQKQLLNERQDIEQIVSKNLKFEGRSSFDSLKIQSFNNDQIVGYLCLDLSEAKLINQNGDSVGTTSEKTPLQVTFSKDSYGGFVLSGSESWSGQNFC